MGCFEDALLADGPNYSVCPCQGSAARGQVGMGWGGMGGLTGGWRRSRSRGGGQVPVVRRGSRAASSGRPGTGENVRVAARKAASGVLECSA
jgi:hypothetical protein